MRKQIGSKIIGFSDVVLLACLFSLFFVQLAGFCKDPGVGWHLKTGEWIFSNRSFIYNDPFLASAVPRAWISDQWLSDLIFYLLYQFGSWPLLYAFVICIYLATFWIFLFNGLNKIYSSILLNALGCFFAFKLAQVHFILRPVVFSFFCFAILYTSLLKWQEFRNRKHIIYLPILFFIWAQLHPAFVLGILVLGILLLSEFIEKFVFKNSLKEFAFLLLIFACSLVFTLVNPYFWHLHQSILALGSSDYFMNLHEEWQPPSFKEYSGVLFLSVLSFLFLAVVLAKRLSFSIFEFIVFAIFTYLAYTAVRFLPFWGIIVAPIFVGLWRNVVEHPRFSFFSIIEVCKRVEVLEKRSLQAKLIYLFIPFYLIFTLYTGNLPFYAGEYGPPKSKFPEVAIDFLMQQADLPSKIVILSEPEWGGFITFKAWPRVQAIIDDRNTLLGEAFYQDFYSNIENHQDIRNFARNLGANYILLPNYLPSVAFLKSQGVTVLYADNLASLFRLN